jgi:hypothetical protein
MLADLAVDAVAVTMVAMRMAGATDNAVRGDETEALLCRSGWPPPSSGFASAPSHMPAKRWKACFQKHCTTFLAT